MALPVLTAVTRPQGANRELVEGRVSPATVGLDLLDVPVLVDAFRRMVRDQAYDVCELACTTYLCAREFGVPITALPIFLVRGFHHQALLVAPGRRTDEPSSLRGSRIGVDRGYTVTTGVWARAVLYEEYGVEPGSVTWVLSGDEHVAAFRPPANVVSAPVGPSLDELVLSGELAALIGPPRDHPELVPLIADPEAAARDSFRRTGVFPINHLVVVRNQVLDRCPGVAADLFDAFARSKAWYVARLQDGATAAQTDQDRACRLVLAEAGGDPLPYGIGPNRHVIDTLVDHTLAQGILTRRPVVEELFHPETLDLVG